MRLYQLIKEQYNFTRSEVNSFFNNNVITINGKLISSMTIRINSEDSILINGELFKYIESAKKYILYYKPKGIICTNDKSITNNIINNFEDEIRLFTVGRLDKDSEGLIILTNDGQLSNKIINGKFHVEKEYVVMVDKIIDDKFLNQMTSGVKLKDKVTKKCFIEKTDDYTFKIILTEGINRQIRRMCLAFGYRVISLRRIRIKNITCDLEVGARRSLTSDEVSDLLQ